MITVSVFMYIYCIDVYTRYWYYVPLLYVIGRLPQKLFLAYQNQMNQIEYRFYPMRSFNNAFWETSINTFNQ